MTEADPDVFADLALFDAGVFIGALLKGDPRHKEARQLVEQARQGIVPACTTAGILSEVYGALTWEQAQPPHTPAEAADAVLLLVEPPSAIQVLNEGLEDVMRLLQISKQHHLTARRVHDARHAATALTSGVSTVYTYDSDDWYKFEVNGLHIAGPPSIISSI